MKKAGKIVLTVLLALLVLAGVFLGVLTLTEYRPESRETLPVSGTASKTFAPGDTLSVLTWNTGYGALGDNADFFMDGGRSVYTADRQRVESNLAAMASALGALDPDLIYLQEVDRGSDRSYGTRQTASYDAVLPGRETVFANNFKTLFVPYPLPPIGRVDSGVYTLSKADIAEAERIQLPCPFSWPIRTVNLKRCLLVTRVPIADSDKELVLVNLHLEAYDDGEGKLAQSKQLREFVEEEYAKGNYVVAGGDWNQLFPKSEKSWPNIHKELWTPVYLDEQELSEGWRYVWDASVPTCRLLNQPYDPKDEANTQYYVIDGFLISPNLKTERAETLDEGFEFSDHNPVLLTLSLGE
jgi:endonuclease/exonuclease/phosphatase family metal-dependent hydrolase